MEGNGSVDASKAKSHLGKIGLLIMVTGLAVLYYDGFTLSQVVPAGYHYYEYPTVHILLISMTVTFAGLGVFIYSFSRGRNII